MIENDEDDVLDPSVQNDELPSDAALGTIAALAARLKAAEDDLVAATNRLKQASAEYNNVANVLLPQALRAAHTLSFTTAGGQNVELKTAYDAKKLTDSAGLAWVEANGGGPLIRTEITVGLDRGDRELAREIMTLLRSHRGANAFVELKLTESVHDKSLGAFVRRLVEARKDPPMDVLGVHRRTYATVGRRPRSVDLKGFERD